MQTSPGASLQTPGGATLAPAPAPRTDVSSDPHAASAALEHVADERGRPCRRSEWFAHERRLAAECLYHAVLSTRRDGGAVSGADAAKIAEVFATVAAPTLAATVAHDRARRAAEAFARMDAAAPPLAIFPDAYPAAAEDLPSAIAMLFALVAATTPAAGGAGGAAPFAAAIDAAGTALDAALAKAEAAAKAALDDAGAGADGDPLRAAFARSPLADAAPPARPFGGHGAVGTAAGWRRRPPLSRRRRRRERSASSARARARAGPRLEETLAAITRVRICSRRTAARRRRRRRRFTSRGSCGR